MPAPFPEVAAAYNAAAIFLGFSSTVPIRTIELEGRNVAYDNLRYLSASLALRVTIDIKPGSWPNSINLRSRGTLPVAILGQSDVDVSTIDPATLTLAGAPVARHRAGAPRSSIEDVNQDGWSDLLLHFETAALSLDADDTEATLEGSTFDGRNIIGRDSVRIVNARSAEHLTDTYRAAIIASGPDGYWRLGEAGGTIATNEVSAARDGTYHGSLAYGVPGALAGDTNAAVRWTGAGYLTAPYDAAPSFSVELWARSAGATWNTFGWLASDRLGNGVIVHPNMSSQSWTGYVVDAYGIYHELGTHAPVEILGWHQYVLTWNDATKTGAMYFDGTLVVSGTLPGITRGSSLNTMNAGLDGCCGVRLGEGTEDELSYYSRVLSAAEISGHYVAALSP